MTSFKASSDADNSFAFNSSRTIIDEKMMLMYPDQQQYSKPSTLITLSSVLKRSINPKKMVDHSLRPSCWGCFPFSKSQ